MVVARSLACMQAGIIVRYSKHASAVQNAAVRVARRIILIRRLPTAGRLVGGRLIANVMPPA